jgi:hypothetical protein
MTTQPPPRTSPTLDSGVHLRTTTARERGAIEECAEEDSNLHPVIPDQALNLVTRVSYPFESRQIVRIVLAR